MKPLEKMKIFLIDDDPDSIVLMLEMLKKQSLTEIRSAKSAQEALDQIRKVLPDLIILDIVMPDVDGYKFCKFLKSDEQTRDIPVIMVTGSAGDYDEAIQKTFELGAVDFITKPLKFTEFIARVKSALMLKQKSDQVQKELNNFRQAEMRLQQSEQTLRTITDTAKDAVVMLDQAGKIMFWNPAAQEMFGFREKEVMGVDLHNLIAPQHYRKASKKGFLKFRKDGQGDAVGKTLELEAQRKDGQIIQIELSLSAIDIKGIFHAVGIVRDISERKKIEVEKEKLISDLTGALDKVKTLSGLLPICASCKKIRDDKGYWNQIEHYIREHSDAEFSHSLCPECVKKLYPELSEED